MEVAAYLHTVGEESRQWNPAADDWGTPKERGCRGGVPLWSVRPLHLPLAVKCGESLRQERTRRQEQTQLLSVDSCLGLSKFQLAPASCQIVLLSSEYL